MKKVVFTWAHKNIIFEGRFIVKKGDVTVFFNHSEKETIYVQPFSAKQNVPSVQNGLAQRLLAYTKDGKNIVKKVHFNEALLEIVITISERWGNLYNFIFEKQIIAACKELDIDATFE